MNRLHPAALALVFVALLAGCGQKEPQEPDCKNPSTQEEKQKCAHKESTEPRIAPTEKPKNWLEVKP
jgi:predicted small lipoprotein YifL